MTFNPLIPFVVLVPLVVVVMIGCCVAAFTRSHQRVMWCLRAVVVFILATAIARPGIPTEVVVLKQEASAQVYLVVDVTASMIAEDWDGSEPRLEGLKKDLTELVDAMPGAKFSLITFGSESHVRVPLTTDDAAVKSAISILAPEITRSSAGTSPFAPAETVSSRLAKGQEAHPGEDQYVFYFGDGEKTSEKGADSFDGDFNLAGGAVFGYGTEKGGKMKETLDSFLSRDPEYIDDPETREPALSKIDESTLKKIASSMGTDYHHRTARSKITQDYSVPSFEQSFVDKKDQRGVDELFWIPLILVYAWIVVETTMALKRVREIARIGRK
ncbi:von Willebrand factor type A domain protein [Brevibacterium mcbrellneri ATCC 49030]|uniref:von Willebrand factor type A domain protein n=1 Tax=Brevibacterium mcbrellneri ATCC 49030 TaxID=585530 RepID=D4YLY6_9MICO|nr:VWA domain-containing protein [Brevibacterium mcbrellneri]EFG47869.1 von Willebrand factor type A domain protein [Brevibacterium mcbrellneri ATCC 49030]